MTATHISVGKPANNSESRVFKYLKENLPDGYTLLTNVRINQGGHGFDFDAILLGKHAIYVIEIKNLGGIIRGDNFNWQVINDDGTVFTPPKNPLAQAEMQASIFSGNLKRWNPRFAEVYVQDLVCLAGEKEPQIEIQDDSLRLKKVQWYRGIEKILTDRSKLLHPPEWKRLITDDIFYFHADIQKGIQTGFSVSPQLSPSPTPLPPAPPPQIIDGFTRGDKAWSSRGYTAYYASRKGVYPERALLKIYKIPPTEDPATAKKYVDGLVREFTALRKMKDTGNAAGGGHKNVAIGYNAFLLNDTAQQINEYVIVMEWVEGKHLFDLVAPHAISLRQKYQIAAQICRGLLFAHSADVVHRNLNLKNILYESSGVVKIVNFDFAKFLGAPPMGTFTLPNSMPEQFFKGYVDDLMKQRKYVAPEIRSGDGLPSYHDANKETDLYSLGIILLELFSGALLENKPSPDLDILRSVAGLDPAAVKSIDMLCSSKVEDRRAISLDRIAKEFTALAQNMEEIPLPKLANGYRFGKYEIISFLSSTYMSVVYHARDVSLGQDVAIKFLRASSNAAVSAVRAAFNSWNSIDPRYTARWLGEGVAFALNGNIEDGSSEDLNAVRVHYLVMEFIEGQNIAQFLGEGVSKPDVALKIGSKIIQAVSAIHAAQWTHRDIKPDNIIVSANHAIHVVDFGLSQRIDEPIGTQQGYSPGYTPPEVRQDEPAPWSYAGDVFSTARVILALLFGKKTLEGPNFDAQKDNAKLKQLVGKEVAELLLRDMDQNPKNRHDSAMSMLKDWESITARREDGMTEIDYEKILQEIDVRVKDRDDEMDYPGAAAYRNKANSLRTWLKNGKQGDCPIDLSEFGVDISSSPKPVIDTPVKKVEEKKPAIKPEPTSTDKEEGIVLLSPEERTLQEQLKEIREHINAERLRQAVALAGIVEGRATGDAKITASELLEEARQKRDAAVEVALKKADSVLKIGDKEQASPHYEVVLGLDPENERAKSAMRQIESDMSAGKLSAQEISELRGGLRDIKNIKRLGASVYKAEALYAEGKLPEELSILLDEAREKYNQIRTAQGEETTMMRIGDIAMRKDARDKIAARLAQGATFIFDVTTNEDKPAYDLLREAEKLLAQQSADTAQYEFDIINGLLPAHPIGARIRLESVLSKPFHEKDKRKLEEKLNDINDLVEKQKEAEAFLSQATKENDEIKSFGTVLKAQGTFSYLPSMEVEVAQARTKAISASVRKMEDAFAQARGMLGKDDSAKARQIINDALKLIDSWPQPEKPEQLQALALEGKRLQEFDTQVSLIRKEVGDQHNVGNALKRLEEMRQDPRFADLPELRAFVSEMDQYRDSGDQLREGREARNQGDWKRVYELTTKIKESKKAGSLGAQVDVLYAEAEQEVRIDDARALLDNLEIKKANSILSQIKATEKDEKRLAILVERFAPEQRIIDDAIKNTPLVQTLYDRAVAMRNGREEERLESLRIFRYLGGITKEKFSADLPEYALTLRTDDARKAAVEVGTALRAKCLDPIQKASRGDKRKKLDVDDMQHFANLARILREGNLIHSPEERSIVRWAEVEWGRHQAKTKEAIQDWDSVVATWSHLNENYPDTEEVVIGLSNALNQQEIVKGVFGRVDDPSAKPRDVLMFIKEIFERPETKNLSALLKDRRDKVFQKAQDDLLKIAREAAASGTNEGKLKAFIALVELRELEDFVEQPESRRRSVAELKSLNPNDFKNVVDVVIQQSGMFSLAQNNIEDSLKASDELISRLQIFMKIAPLFAGRLFELDERLEKRKNELALMRQKLKEVHTILEEVRKPELWDDAISRSSFDVLRVRRDAMGAQGLSSLTSIPDIKEFDQKMREMQEAYEHIKGQITLVKQAFDVSEDFKQAVKLLRLLVSRPMDWQIVSQAQYEHILNQMDYQFRVSNVFGSGKTLAGRTEIEAEALRRDEQYDIWRAWEKTCDVKMVEAERCAQIVNSYELGTKSVPTREQRQDWENVLLGAQSALDALTNPPDGLREKILSRKTMEIFDNSKAKIDLAEEWKHSAEQSLKALDHILQSQGFPSPEEFNATTTRNDLQGLKNLIAQAEQAGALADDEKKRLAAYKNTYQRMIQLSQKPKSWWNLR